LQGALGQPLIPDADQLTKLSPALLREFLTANYTGGRMVLAASGVEHSTLVALATPMLEQVPAGVGMPEPLSKYTGAYCLLPGAHPQPNLLLAFEYQGGWRDVEGAVAMTVLTYLLGGGSSFSSGGPGKGMHSRLYTRVLTQYAWAHSCTAFNSTFNESMLVGIQASCEPGNVADMLDVMCGELEAVARNVGEVELSRAKRAAVSVISNALESKVTGPVLCCAGPVLCCAGPVLCCAGPVLCCA
jgi:processing peptidase subunit alpha